MCVVRRAWGLAVRAAAGGPKGPVACHWPHAAGT